MVGVVGAGQLARMLATPAGELGIAMALLAEAPDGSAAQVIPDTVVGDYRDLDTLRRFSEGLDVLTFDHEHVPTEHLRALVGAGIRCRPGPEALVYAQDKLAMRRRLAPAPADGGLGVPCPPFAQVSCPDDVADFAGRVGWPVVLKIARGGYDGRGVWRIDGPEAPGVAEAFAEAAARGVEVLAEQHVPFVRELAALAVRSPGGQAVAYPVVQSTQRDGICHEVIAPAPGPRRHPGAGGAATRADGRAGAGGHRGARGRAVRDHGRFAAGERTRDAAAQHRALEHRGGGDESVREPPARRARPAAGVAEPRGPRGR